MNTIDTQNLVLSKIDRRIIELAWDAEIIAREQDCPIYSIAPPGPKDALIAASVGATTATVLKSPVIIWRNDGEET